MSNVTILSRIAAGAFGALIIGALALAQTPSQEQAPGASAPAPAAPAPAPGASAPAPAAPARAPGASAPASAAPAPAPAAATGSGLPLTATITTPGYPAPAPADPALRVLQAPGGKKIHVLPATLETTQWGWFDNAQPPVLRVRSGDTIILEAMMHSHTQMVAGATVEQIKTLRTDFPGRGPHTLTGPIYIEEAQSGDVLKVRINRIVPRAYASNFNVPGMFGQFPNVFKDGQVKYMYLDL